MKHLIIQCDEGPVYLAGRLHTDASRPALVAVGGAWGLDDDLHFLIDAFPGASVLVAPFPGMGESRTRRFDVATMSRIFDEAIGHLFPETPVVTFGASAGSLVTLGLRSPRIVRHVALEPFFRTAPLWPLLKFARTTLAPDPQNAAAAAAAEALFGFTADAVMDRDYRRLLDGLQVPTDVILADLPLEPERELSGWPSLTGAEDRAGLEAHPRVTVHAGPPGSGHGLSATPGGAAAIRAVVGSALRWALAAPHPARP
jgi:hypothetical protein